jgi:hypothetical protein
MTANVAIGEHVNDFRVGRRARDPAMFVTAAEDECLKSHGAMYYLAWKICPKPRFQLTPF